MDTDLTGTAESGKSELNALIGNRHGFDTVKPVQLLKYLIKTKIFNKNWFEKAVLNEGTQIW